MKRFAVQSRLVRTSDLPKTAFGKMEEGSSLDFVALHVIAKKQVEHTAITVVSVYAALKVTDVLATTAKHLIQTKIK